MIVFFLLRIRMWQFSLSVATTWLASGALASVSFEPTCKQPQPDPQTRIFVKETRKNGPVGRMISGRKEIPFRFVETETEFSVPLLVYLSLPKCVV